MENNFLLAQSSGGFFVQIIPLILIFAIFWFLIIRPQQKRLKIIMLWLVMLRRVIV
jgi:preprotein translocase subunit YajC